MDDRRRNRQVFRLSVPPLRHLCRLALSCASLLALTSRAVSADVYEIPRVVRDTEPGFMAARPGSSHDFALTGLLVQDPVVRLAPIGQDFAVPGPMSTEGPYADNGFQHYDDRAQGVVQKAEGFRIARDEAPRGFFDETAIGLPAPTAAPAPAAEQEPPAPPSGPGGSASPDQKPLDQAETLGNAPQDYSLQFLRRQTVLLRPGQCQVDVGVSYLLDENDFPSPLFAPQAPPPPPPGDVLHVVEGRVKQRLLLVPFEIRYGLTDRMQLFVNVPVGWANTELAIPDYGLDEFDNEGGIGDVTAGVTVLLREREGYCPDVIGTIGFTAPTGNATFPFVLANPASQLGEGYWSVLGSLLCIHTYDPIVLYYGLSGRYRFENTFLDIYRVEPGALIGYQFGVGFALNERITLSTTFIGSYILDNYVNDDRIEGSSLEPMVLRFSATIAQYDRIVEPFAQIGMTEDAPSARIGVIWTF